MTAKQDLHDLVDEMPDEEAAAWLRRICDRRAIESLSYEESLQQPLIVGSTDLDEVVALIREWQASPSSDDEAILAELERSEQEHGGFAAREAPEW